jgi:hypothetical protein
MNNEIPDAYKEAAQHTEKQPCNLESLEQWTTQKAEQCLHKNRIDNVSYSFWNYARRCKRKEIFGR